MNEDQCQADNDADTSNWAIAANVCTQHRHLVLVYPDEILVLPSHVGEKTESTFTALSVQPLPRTVYCYRFNV